MAKLNNGQLMRLFNLDSTKIVLEPCICVDYEWAAICQTAKGKFIGAVTRKGKMLAVAEMTHQQYSDAWDEATEYNPGNGTRECIIAKHVREAAGYIWVEDCLDDVFGGFGWVKR
jgi:hypothetical protein